MSAHVRQHQGVVWPAEDVQSTQGGVRQGADGEPFQMRLHPSSQVLPGLFKVLHLALLLVLAPDTGSQHCPLGSRLCTGFPRGFNDQQAMVVPGLVLPWTVTLLLGCIH